MEEFNLSNPDPNIKVIKLTGDNLIPNQKEFNIETEDNNQLNFSKIDNSKDNLSSKSTDINEITLDIPNEINFDNNITGGAEKNNDSDLSDINLDAKEIKLELNDNLDNSMELNLDNIDDLKLSDYNEIDLDNNGDLNTSDIKEINLGENKNSEEINLELPNEIKLEDNEIKLEDNEIKLDNNEIKLEDNEIELDNNVLKLDDNVLKLDDREIKLDAINLDNENVSNPNKLKSNNAENQEDINEEDSLKITNMLNSYNKLNKLSKLPVLEGGGYETASEIESILPKNLTILENGLFEIAKIYVEKTASTVYKEYLELLEEFFSERMKKSYIKTNMYYITDTGQFVKQCKSETSCESDFKITPPKYMKIDSMLKYLKSKLDYISSNLRVQRDNFIEISLNKKKPKSLQSKIESFEQKKEEYDVCHKQYQLFYQYKDLVNGISYNEEQLTKLKDRYKEAKFTNKIEYNKLIESINSVEDISTELRGGINTYLKNTDIKQINDEIYSIKNDSKNIDFIMIESPVILKGSRSRTKETPKSTLPNNLGELAESPLTKSSMESSAELSTEPFTESPSDESPEKVPGSTIPEAIDLGLEADSVGLEGGNKTKEELKIENLEENTKSKEELELGNLDEDLDEDLELSNSDNNLDTNESKTSQSSIELDDIDTDLVSFDLDEDVSDKSNKDQTEELTFDNLDKDVSTSDHPEELTFDNLDEELGGLEDPEKLAELGEVIQGLDDNNSETIDLSGSSDEVIGEDDDTKIIKGLNLFEDKSQKSNTSPNSHLDSILKNLAKPQKSQKTNKKNPKKKVSKKLKIVKKK